MGARMDMAKQKGCDGVEPDNVDAYTSDNGGGGFKLTYDDQIKYNTWLAQEAHARDLSVGLKNDLDQIEDLVTYFDWALNEQCWEYNECDALSPFIEGSAFFSGKSTFLSFLFSSKQSGLQLRIQTASPLSQSYPTENQFDSRSIGPRWNKYENV